MASMTFQINDSTTTGGLQVWVTITENADGTLAFTIWQEGGIVGDLRGIFFDIADESLLGTLSVASDEGVTEFRSGDDSIKDLGDGANMNGMLGSDKGYDAGVEVGSAGIGKDDIQSYSFTLDSSARDLTLADFANVDFGMRLTSVGTIDGKRTDSAKMLETTQTAVDANDDHAVVAENDAISGNVLANDTLGSDSAAGAVVTGWSGGAVGEAATLMSGDDLLGSLVLNADGSYTLDASAADALSQGESITYSFTYEIRYQNDETSWSTDTATLSVVIEGRNDGPQAGDDAAATVENEDTTTGNVLDNDSDIDRLDTIAVTGWSGGDLGQALVIDNAEGATLTLNADGSYVLDAGAADALSEGESITQTVTYTIADNHGATDTATLTVTVTGRNDGPDAVDDEGGSVEENATLTGDVTGNDSDIDRLDTHTFSLVSDWSGPGNLTFNEDGTWSYNAGDLSDLHNGETLDLSFDYVMTDNHGATDIATVRFTVLGTGDIVVPPTDPEGEGDGDGNPPSGPVDSGFDFPDMLQAISNVVLYLDDGDAETELLKVKISPLADLYDVDSLDFAGFFAAHGDALGGNTTLVGISVHAGQEYPNVNDVDGTKPGEGVFFYLMDGQNPVIEAVGTRDASGGWTMNWEKDNYPLSQDAMDAGFSDDLLMAAVDQSYDYDGGWMV